MLPEYIKGSDITVNVGVTWIPAEYYGQFAAELFNMPQSDISVTYNPNGGYDVDFSGSWAVRMSPENTKIWGSKNMPFFYESERKPGLLFSLLNNKDLTVKYKDPDGKTIYDAAATEELRTLKDKINSQFNKWLWKDAERRVQLEEVYNDSFNCMVRPSYSSDTVIADQAADIKLRDHQGKAVNRIVQSPYNTLLQHGAGAGKTYAMIGSVMKLRQLGIAKKPVIVVPKNKIGDWRNDFFKMFPSAKVLVADDTTFAKANRKVFTNKIATTDVDAVIMSKEQFQYIPMTKEYQEQFYQSQIDSCIAAIEEARTSKGKNKSTSRQIEKRKSQLEKKLKELGETKKDYDNISFEDTGIDYIFADEAQSYKNLMYNTNRSNVADMGAPDGNQITFDMLMKSNYMRSKQNGKGLVFGTATPVMNSPVEAYTMLKYLANEELEKRGIRNLDNFIDMFGKIESQTRQDAVGRNWTTRNAFSGFINMNEWQQLWGMITDVVRTQDVPGIVLPKMKGGDRNVIVCEAGDAARDIIEGLADRLKKNEKKGENHVFALQSDGKKASFSQRLIDPSLPYGENEKVPVAVNEIYKIWNESKTFKDKDGNTQKNGVQLVFCDYGVPKDSNSKTKSDEEFNPNAEVSDERVNVYQDMKDMLVAKGVPSDEIAFIHDAKNDSQRDVLYDKVRSGEVRVLIGSSKKMGEGLNVQDRIVALHEMNPLARPGDIEQVEARAIRQGNLSPEVAVNVYVTKDTFDTKQWDTLRNKAKFIAEITSGEYTGRNADFSSDEFGASAADIMAISSGNPLLKEQVETNEQLRKLENLEKAFKRKVYDAQVELDKSEKQINHYKELLPKYQADAKKVRDISGDNFIGRVSGKTLTKRKDFGVGLIEASKKAINSSEDIVKVGTFGGLDLYVSGITPMAELRGEASYTSKLNYDSPEGTVTRLTNVLEGVKNKAKEAETIIKTNEKNIPKLQEIIESKFDNESELSEVRNRAKDIEAQLLVSDNDAITSSNDEVLARKIAKPLAGNGKTDNSEIGHIKEQIKSHSNELNKMEVVATVPIKPYPAGMVKTDIAKNIAKFFERFGFKIPVKGIGDVVIDEKRIKQSLHYTGNLAELMAYKSLPYVLKNGIEIGTHDNHKGRNYKTITIAAPVSFINVESGKKIRGNVGVVIKKTTDNFYKVHRVLAPDGTVLDIEKAEATNVEGELSRSPIAATIASATTDNVTLERKNGKQNAIKTEVDNSADWTATKTSDNKVEKPKRLSDIIADIQHEFGMNITVGHIRNRDTAGEFNTRDKGAKTRTANDLPTIAHELGHWFDDQYKITSSTLPKEVEADFKKALGTLADEYMPSLRTKEGMAEFFRKYLQNREIAAIDYPEATKYLLSKLSPLDLARITSLADQVNAYYSMGAENAQGSIRLNEDRIIDRRTKFEKAIDKKDQIYQAMVDSNHGIRLMGKSVGNNSAYISAANAAYSDARTEQIILGDLTDYDGNYVGAGFKTALNGLDTNPKHEMYGDFGEYLILKHGQEFLAQGKRVFASDEMNSTQWMQNRLEELDEKYPEFEKMSYRLYNFLTEFTQTWAVDTGLISQDDFNRMQALYPNYVPFFRAGFKTRGNSLSRAKGSGRDIINPIDNIINMVTKTVNTATRNHVLLDIRKVALDEGVDASFIEKIPDPLVPKKFDARGLKAQLANDSFDIMAENNASFEVMDAMQTLIDNINDTLVQFEIGKARGDVIQMLVNGKKEFWKVNDKLLLDSITNMNAHTANAVLNAYGKMTRFMTSNITGRNIIWSIFSNMPRDIQTAYTYFDGYNPLPLIKGIGSAYLNSFRHAAGKSVAPYFSEYLSMGGGGAGVWQGQESYVSDMRKKLNTVNPKSFNMFESIAFVSDTIEMGPRFAMYVHLREHGRNQQQAFYEAMDLTVNFRRHGTVSRDINKVSQFFNASVQGVDKSVRFFTGEDIKGTNPKQRAMAVKKRVGMYIAISAALAAMNYAINNTDDENKKYYQVLSSYTKNSYFLIPLNGKGEYFAIPKARELSVLTSMFERILEYSSGGNKHAFDDFYSYWGENCLPNIISEFVQFPFRIADNGLNQAIEDTVAGVLGSLGIIGVFAESMANRDFLGRPIVSNTYKERMPKDQYDARTSEFAYLLGNALNISPKKIDHMADNTLGVMWEVPAAVLPIDDGKGTKGERDWTVGIKNKYRKSAAYSNDISNWIYDERSKSEAKANHYEDDIDAAIAYKMDNLYASFYTNFNKLNKNNHISSQKEAKYSVLDMLVGYRNAKENGIYPDGMVAVMSVIKNSKDTSLLPNAMNTYVKDKDKKQFDLSDVRYVEYQTLYNKYYFENAEEQLDLSSDINTQVSVLKKCKEAAKNKATNDMLKLFSGAKIDRSEDNAGMNIAKSNYKAALTEAREKDENHEITAFEKYELAIEYAKKSKDKTFTAEDFYYDSLDKDSKAKYDSWTKAGGSFDNYDELLELNDIPADKKSDGNSIPNSKKNKVADAITSQGWNEKLMQIAWERAGYKDDLNEYMSTKKYNYTGYRVNGASLSGTSNKKVVNSTSSLNSSWTGITF